MLQEAGQISTPGLVKLNSIRVLRLYLKDLMSTYEKETDLYGEKVGRLMRILEENRKGKDVKKLKDVEWKRSGMVMLSTKEPGRGTLELLIEAMEDCKAKAARTAEVLANIDELEKLGISERAGILVYLRHGVPLRIVVDAERNPEVDELITPIA